MLAHVIRAAMEQCPGIDPARIDDAIIGCAMPEAEQGMNVARIGVLLAGLPDTVPGVTINRFCSSGVQAVAMAADRIRLGEADLMLAGGTESMSMVPMMGHKVAMNPAIFNDENVAIAYGMGITAEKVAEQWKVTARAAGRLRAWKATAAPWPPSRPASSRTRSARTRWTTATRTWPTAACTRTAHHRHRRRPARRAPRRRCWPSCAPVFRNGQFGGSVTAGNSSQMSDGAGAVMLASEQAIKEYGLTPLARFVSFSVAGVPPEVMGIGPKEAIPKALKQAGLTQDQMDWIELNEAFAAQSLAVMRRPRPRPGQGQPAGRRDRARPPAGRHRRHPRGHAGARPAPAQAEVRHGDHVHRHRHGRGGDFRGAVNPGP